MKKKKVYDKIKDEEEKIKEENKIKKRQPGKAFDYKSRKLYWTVFLF